MSVTNQQIREYLGHNGSECRVRISRDGRITRHGSPNPTDRSQDFWAYMGEKDDYPSTIIGSVVETSRQCMVDEAAP